MRTLKRRLTSLSAIAQDRPYGRRKPNARQEGGARLFRGPGHLHHPEMAADRISGPRWSPSPPTSARASELGPAREKALLMGVKPENIFVDDLREEFVRDFVFPMFRANTVYEGQYLLGTSIARPLIAKKPDRDRAAGGRRRGLSRRHRQGQRSGAFRARLLRAGARHPRHRPLARVGIQEPRGAARLRRKAPDPHRQGQARRGALQRRRQPSALLIRRQSAGRPGGGGARVRAHAHHRAGGCAGQTPRLHPGFRAGRSGQPSTASGCPPPPCWPP